MDTMNGLSTGACCLAILLCTITFGQEANGVPITGGMTLKTGNPVDDFSNSLKLSRKLLRETRLLAHDYRLWKLPGAHLDFVGHSQNVPSVSIDFRSWLKLQPGERLQQLYQSLQVFPSYLDELEKWLKEETNDRSSHVKEKVSKVRPSLRDLLDHLQMQMTSHGIRPQQVLVTWQGSLTNGRGWCSRLLMFQALRTLEQSLLRAVRDYTLLQCYQG